MLPADMLPKGAWQSQPWPSTFHLFSSCLPVFARMCAYQHPALLVFLGFLFFSCSFPHPGNGFTLFSTVPRYRCHVSFCLLRMLPKIKPSLPGIIHVNSQHSTRHAVALTPSLHSAVLSFLRRMQKCKRFTLSLTFGLTLMMLFHTAAWGWRMWGKQSFNEHS